MEQVSEEALSTRPLLNIFYIKSHNFGVFMFNKAVMAKELILLSSNLTFLLF